MKIIKFVLLFAQILSAQNTCVIRVIDRLQQFPIQHAQIRLESQNLVAYSDSLGFARFPGCKAKEFAVIHAFGYTDYKGFIDHSKMNTVELDLSPHDLKSVVIVPQNVVCKKLRFPHEKKAFPELLFRGTVIRRKLQLEQRFLCGYRVVVYAKRAARVVLRPYVTDALGQSIVDVPPMTFALKPRWNNIDITLPQAAYLQNAPFYLGFECVDVPDEFSNNMLMIRTTSGVPSTSGMLALGARVVVEQNVIELGNRTYPENIYVVCEVAE